MQLLLKKSRRTIEMELAMKKKESRGAQMGKIKKITKE